MPLDHARVTDGVLDGEDLAVLVSIADDASQAFGLSLESLPDFAGMVEVLAPRPLNGKFYIASAGQAVESAEMTVEAIRRARRTYHPLTLHLFLAVPLGLAFLLG